MHFLVTIILAKNLLDTCVILTCNLSNTETLIFSVSSDTVNAGFAQFCILYWKNPTRMENSINIQKQAYPSSETCCLESIPCISNVLMCC